MNCCNVQTSIRSRAQKHDENKRNMRFTSQAETIKSFTHMSVFWILNAFNSQLEYVVALVKIITSIPNFFGVVS